MTDSWQKRAAAAWAAHQAAMTDTTALDEATAMLKARLDLLGIDPAGEPMLGPAGSVRVLLQAADATRAWVVACARDRTLWLEATPGVDGPPDGWMHAGELATIADVGRALAGDDLQPLQQQDAMTPADMLLHVLEALVEDAVDAKLAGHLE